CDNRDVSALGIAKCLGKSRTVDSSDKEKVYLISDHALDIVVLLVGIIIRILASDIRVMGRIAKGVRVMRVSEGANVVAFTRAEHDDNAETEKVEQLTEEQLKEAEAEAALEEQNEVIDESAPEDDDNEE
ncbi:MAG: hypothetical protein J6X85_10215, partial [Ruminococcus sp.]|nr:hypothetical protein [Ruminococcus sp.]